MTSAMETPGRPSESGWRWVFFGPHGLRAGWSLLIFIAIGLAIEAARRPLPEAVDHAASKPESAR